MRFDTFLQRAAQRHPALVFQVSWANGLDIIRDLSAEGVPLLALDANPRALGLRSRLAAGMVCPDPRDDEEAFVAFLEDLGRRLPRKGVLFPTHDQYIWPISRHAERLEPYYLIPFSRWETMERLHDKRAQMEAAWRAGVDTPKTVFVDSAEDLERGVEEIGFPCIFKPVESLAFKTRFRRHVLEIGSAEELRETYAKVDDCGTLMLQDIVPGGDEELYTLGSYLDAQSRPLAVFTGHKLRQHPPRFGHVSMAVSRWVPELAEAGLRLLDELGYHGVSQVEFKRDPRDGKLPPHGGQRAALDVALARHRLRRQPLARRLPRRHRRAVHVGAPVRRSQVGRLAHRRARRVLGAGATATRSCCPWLKSYRGVKVDGLYSLRDPFPGALHHGAPAAGTS